MNSKMNSKKLKEIKNRVKFTRKKKCDVCGKIKTVSHECEDCYYDGFLNTANNFYKMGKNDLIKELLKDLEENPKWKMLYGRRPFQVVDDFKKLLKRKGEE